MGRLKARVQWWLKVRAAKKWRKLEDQKAIVQMHSKAMSREVTFADRSEAMKKGIFI